MEQALTGVPQQRPKGMWRPLGTVAVPGRYEEVEEVGRHAGRADDDSGGESASPAVFAGNIVDAGEAKVVVLAVGDSTINARYLINGCNRRGARQTCASVLSWRGNATDMTDIDDMTDVDEARRACTDELPEIEQEDGSHLRRGAPRPGDRWGGGGGGRSGRAAVYAFSQCRAKKRKAAGRVAMYETAGAVALWLLRVAVGVAAVAAGVMVLVFVGQFWREECCKEVWRR